MGYVSINGFLSAPSCTPVGFIFQMHSLSNAFGLYLLRFAQWESPWLYSYQIMWLVLWHSRAFEFVVCIYIYIFFFSPEQERYSNHWINKYWILTYRLCCCYAFCRQSFTKLNFVNLIIVPESPENFEMDGTGSTLSHLLLKLTFVCT